MIVLLRVGIGWHFLYEGIHKFEPAADFSAEGFLGIAKGPAAELYYGMLPDLNGLERLKIAKIRDENGDDRDTFVVYENAWKEYFTNYLGNFEKYFPELKLSEKESAAIVEMNAEKLAEWVAKNAVIDPTVAKDVISMNAMELAGWVAKKALLNKAEAEQTANMNIEKLTAWAKQANDSDTDATKEAKKVILMNAAQLAEWAWTTNEADTDGVKSAKRIAGMNALQLAEWAKGSENDTDVLRGVKKVVVTWHVAMAKTVFNRYLNSLRADTAAEKDKVEAFKASRARFLETTKTIRNTTSFEQERRWQLMMAYRAEAATWIRILNSMGNSLQSDLGRLVDPQLAGQKGGIITEPEKELFPQNSFGLNYTIPDNSYVKSRMDVLNLSVMIGLTAIGLCLVLGFCTRLACLAGTAFLINIVLTTYPVPGVYPPIPTMVGNFMFVSKDVVELLALLVLALVPAGRWGGLDYFLWNYGGKQFVGLFTFGKEPKA